MPTSIYGKLGRFCLGLLAGCCLSDFNLDGGGYRGLCWEVEGESWGFCSTASNCSVDLCDLRNKCHDFGSRVPETCATSCQEQEVDVTWNSHF